MHQPWAFAQREVVGGLFFSAMSTPLPQDLAGVRKQPSPLIALIAFIGYLAVLIVTYILVAGDIDFGDLAATPGNTRDVVVIPVLVATVYLTVVTTLLGWWKPALRDSSAVRKAPKWMWALPVFAVLMCAINLTQSEHRGDFTTIHWTWIIVGFLLVGFSEELMTRGLLVVGFRSKFGEKQVIVLTSLLFAVMHGTNILFGQSASSTIAQVAFNIPMGVLFYTLRRTSGSLILPMLVHALWDISLVVFGGTAGSLNELDPDGPQPATVIPVVAFCVIALLVHRKRLLHGDAQTAGG